MTKISEILDRAADRIKRDGWHQGYYFPKDIGLVCNGNLRQTLLAKNPPCCAWGAVIAESEDHLIESAALDDLLEEVNSTFEHEGDRWAEIPDWNDAEETNEEDVIAAFRNAAASARRQGR